MLQNNYNLVLILLSSLGYTVKGLFVPSKNICLHELYEKVSVSYFHCPINLHLASCIAVYLQNDCLSLSLSRTTTYKACKNDKVMYTRYVYSALKLQL